MRESVFEQQSAEQGAVSVDSPTQSLPPKKGAEQARARIFLPHGQAGSQWDHCPHDCHSPDLKYVEMWFPVKFNFNIVGKYLQCQQWESMWQKFLNQLLIQEPN